MYERCTKCNWKTWIGDKKSTRKTCPKCKSPVVVTK